MLTKKKTETKKINESNDARMSDEICNEGMKKMRVVSTGATDFSLRGIEAFKRVIT